MDYSIGHRPNYFARGNSFGESKEDSLEHKNGYFGKRKSGYIGEGRDYASIFRLNPGIYGQKRPEEKMIYKEDKGMPKNSLKNGADYISYSANVRKPFMGNSREDSSYLGNARIFTRKF